MCSIGQPDPHTLGPGSPQWYASGADAEIVTTPATLTCLVERKQFLLAYGLAKSAGMEDFQGLGELEKEFEEGGGRGVEEEGKDGDEVEESKS